MFAKGVVNDQDDWPFPAVGNEVGGCKEWKVAIFARCKYRIFPNQTWYSRTLADMLEMDFPGVEIG